MDDLHHVLLYFRSRLATSPNRLGCDKIPLVARRSVSISANTEQHRTSKHLPLRPQTQRPAQRDSCLATKQPKQRKRIVRFADEQHRQQYNSRLESIIE